MSVTSSRTVGIGFQVTPELRAEKFEGFDEDDFSQLGLTLGWSCEYDCPAEEWLMVPIETGDKWKSVDHAILEFLEKLGKLGIKKTKDDLVFISEPCEY